QQQRKGRRIAYLERCADEVDRAVPVALCDGLPEHDVDGVVVEGADQELARQAEQQVPCDHQQADHDRLDGEPPRGAGRLVRRRRRGLGHCPPSGSPSYRLSLRYSVEGSIPRTSAARVLLPPSLCSTQVMYARSITSSVGLGWTRSDTSGSARRSESFSGSVASSIVSPLVSTAARSRAFSSSRTFPGQS